MHLYWKEASDVSTADAQVIFLSSIFIVSAFILKAFCKSNLQNPAGKKRGYLIRLKESLCERPETDLMYKSQFFKMTPILFQN